MRRWNSEARFLLEVHERLQLAECFIHVVGFRAISGAPNLSPCQESLVHVLLSPAGAMKMQAAKLLVDARKSAQCRREPGHNLVVR